MAYTSKLALQPQGAVRIFDLQRSQENLTDRSSVRSEKQWKKGQSQSGTGTGGSVV
jgi:hypothetical protein